MSRFREALRHGRVLASVTPRRRRRRCGPRAVCDLAGVAAASAAPVAPRHGLGGRPVAAGTVTSVPADNAFTITTRAGTTSDRRRDDSTTYVERGVSSPSLDDVTQGALVALFGTISGTTVSATEVSIWVSEVASDRSRSPSRHRGDVSPADNAFTITTHAGTTLTVDVDRVDDLRRARRVQPVARRRDTRRARRRLRHDLGDDGERDRSHAFAPLEPSRNVRHGGSRPAHTVDDGLHDPTWNGTTVTVDVTVVDDLCRARRVQALARRRDRRASPSPSSARCRRRR